jgi:hypothetical protein
LHFSLFPGECPTRVFEQSFPGALEHAPYSQVESSKKILQNSFSILYSCALILFRCFLRDAENREHSLKFLWAVVEKNRDRLKLSHDPRQTSSEGFLINLGAIMTALANPFVVPGTAPNFAVLPPKGLEHIDSMYLVMDRIFLENSGVKLMDETKLFFSKTEWEQWLENHQTEISSQNSSPFSLMNSIFFLTHYVLHYGLMVSLKMFDNFNIRLSRTKQQLNQLRSLRDSDPRYEPQAVQMEQQWNLMLRARLCFESALIQPDMLRNTLQFYVFTAQWVHQLWLKQHNKYGNKQEEDVNMNKNTGEGGVPKSNTFGLFPAEAIPEFFVENIAEFFQFLLRFVVSHPAISMQFSHAPLLNPDIWVSLFPALLSFIGNSKCIKKPYLRAKFAEILSESLNIRNPGQDRIFKKPGMESESDEDSDNEENRGGNSMEESGFTTDNKLYSFSLRRGGALSKILLENNGDISTKILIATVQLFVDVEHTEGNQFYEKFSIRRNLCVLLKILRKIPHFSLQFYQYYSQDTQKISIFGLFCNMLINDCIHLMDEFLLKLPDIKKLENELAGNREGAEGNNNNNNNNNSTQIREPPVRPLTSERRREIAETLGT